MESRKGQRKFKYKKLAPKALPKHKLVENSSSTTTSSNDIDQQVILVQIMALEEEQVLSPGSSRVPGALGIYKGRKIWYASQKSFYGQVSNLFAFLISRVQGDAAHSSNIMPGGPMEYSDQASASAEDSVPEVFVVPI